MWFDHVEHMEDGQEQNKEWENSWWTVDEDMFTYVMKSKIEELINEKLNQEFPEEVEIRENQDYDSEEEMTSETEETDDDESETNHVNVNNYLDSANMVMNLETAMKIAEEEDLWIGDSGWEEKSQFKYELGRLMGEYAVPLPLGNFHLRNKEARRLEL